MATPVPDGSVEITSVSSGLVLDVNESGLVVQEEKNRTRSNQQWQLIPVDGATEGTYYIERYGSGGDGGDPVVLAATPAKFAPMLQTLRAGASAQQWTVQPASGNGYKIVHDSRLISVKDNSDEPQASIILWKDENQENQQWELVHSGQPKITDTSVKTQQLTQKNRVAIHADTAWGAIEILSAKFRASVTRASDNQPVPGLHIWFRTEEHLGPLSLIFGEAVTNTAGRAILTATNINVMNDLVALGTGYHATFEGSPEYEEARSNNAMIVPEIGIGMWLSS